MVTRTVMMRNMKHTICPDRINMVCTLTRCSTHYTITDQIHIERIMAAMKAVKSMGLTTSSDKER